MDQSQSELDLQLGLPWDDESSPIGAGQSGFDGASGASAGVVGGRGDSVEMPRAAFRHPQAQQIRLGQALVAYEFKRARRRKLAWWSL